MRLNKSIFAALIFAASILSLSALEVNETELRSVGNNAIVFINYTGPHSKIDSISSIRKIGSDMGKAVSSVRSSSTRAGNPSRYSVIHAVDPSEKEKLDADIILLGKDAGVDHIDNLRRIIAAYIEESYGYSESDARTIAVFVTVYNAVYRGNLDKFLEKYKKVVTGNLSSSSCGLSVNYREWPGSSQIVIPLYDVNGGLSTIDTTVITSTEVVKRMQEDDDKNIEARKNMVDIKEREAEEAAKKAQDAQKTATEEKKKLVEVQKKTDKAKTEAETAKKQAEENPRDKKAQAEAQKKQETYEKQQTAQKEQEKVVENAEKTANEQQQMADKKNDEAQTERKTIANDQQEVIKREIENSRAPSAYAIRLTDEASMLSGLIKVNTNNGEIIQSSPVTVIRNRTMFSAAGNFIAIAGENSGNGAVKLVLLSPDTMEITKESNEIVAEESVLVQDNGEYYCVIKSTNGWAVGKYSADLTLLLKSNVNISPSTPMTITSEYVIVSETSGRVRLLKKNNLEAL